MQFRERRRFLITTLRSLGGLIAVRLGWLFPEARPAIAEQSRGHAATLHQPHLDVPGERYAGFVLLPEGARVPADVQDYRHGIPSGCGVGNTSTDRAAIRAVQTELASAAEVARHGGFPVYTLGAMPAWLRPASHGSIRHGSGELFGGWTAFEAYSRELRRWYTAVSIQAQVDFPRPVPLWASKAVEPGGPSVVLEKVDFLATPGVLIAGQHGFALHWIQHDVYYILTADLPDAIGQSGAVALGADSLRTRARALAATLTLAG